MVSKLQNTTIKKIPLRKQKSITYKITKITLTLDSKSNNEIRRKWNKFIIVSDNN